MQDVADDILRLAKEQGFALAGIAPAGPSSYIDAVRDWVDAGKHGTMGYLAEHLDLRLDPGRLLEGAQSVIAVADIYDAGDSPDPRSPIPDSRSKGKIARYARGDDYHKVIKKRLHALADTLAERFPGEAFRTTVDTAPALEREHAARAGLGWQARNTMMIHPRHGSYTLLGLIVTTLRVEGQRGKGAEGQGKTAEVGEGPDNAAPLPLNPSAPSVPDHCGHCTRCIDACPTDAIAPDGYSIDASRCVSYLTIEHRGVIAEAFHEGMGDWIAGCDICQEVCPYNAVAARHPLPVLDRYTPRPALAEGLELMDVLHWTAEDRAAAVQGSALKRIKLDMFRRNALIAAGNTLAQRDDPALRDAVRRCLDDESDLVKTTAHQVTQRLTPTP